MSNLVLEAEQLLENVALLKSDADADRDFDDYEGAFGHLERAITELTRFRKKLQEAASGGATEAGMIERDIALKLSDFYGMRGGVLRRLNQLEEAEASYRLGADIEDDFGFEVTYNRTNVLVLELLREPARIVEVQLLVASAREALIQATRGEEKNRWWSWADLGLLHLLSIERSETERLADAKFAYNKVRVNGAQEQHYESIINVLEPLAAGFEKVNPEVRAPILKIIDDLNNR